MFSKIEVQELLNIISKNSLFFIASQLGKHLLLPDDKLFLEKQGIDLSKIKTIHTPIEQAYLFGHVSTLLDNNIVKKMTFKDFKKYLTSDKWLPLIEKERATLTAVENFAYNEIKGLGNRYVQKLGNTVIEVDEKLELSRKAAIKDKAKEAVFKRENKQWLSSELRRTTEDWERDWSRTADYIMSSAYSKGGIAAAKKRDGEESKVWMWVYPQACKYCIAAYLTNGIGSRPRVFLVSELERNGTNIGRKADEVKAVIPPMHPWCRCTVQSYDSGSEWNEKTKTFKKPKYKSKYKPMIKVTINGKEYEG